MSKKRTRKKNAGTTNKKVQKDNRAITPGVVKLDDEQMKIILDELTQMCEWSTNRIVDETQCKFRPMIKREKTDMFSSILRCVLAGMFLLFGVCVIAGIVANWTNYWKGGIDNTVTLFMLLVGLASSICGIDIFREKDRSYIVSLFSAIVALVALIIVLIDR